VCLTQACVRQGALWGKRAGAVPETFAQDLLPLNHSVCFLPPSLACGLLAATGPSCHKARVITHRKHSSSWDKTCLLFKARMCTQESTFLSCAFEHKFASSFVWGSLLSSVSTVSHLLHLKLLTRCELCASTSLPRHCTKMARATNHPTAASEARTAWSSPATLCMAIQSSAA
jgi:hypothetical protein